VALYDLVNGQFDLKRGSHDIPLAGDLCHVGIGWLCCCASEMLGGARVQYLQLFDDVMVGSEPM
jgi:hypothetical protein